jgi:hypothetical protein
MQKQEGSALYSPAARAINAANQQKKTPFTFLPAATCKDVTSSGDWDAHTVLHFKAQEESEIHLFGRSGFFYKQESRAVNPPGKKAKSGLGEWKI